MSYIVDQQTISFHRLLARSYNAMLRTLLWFKSDFILLLAAKYNLPRL